MAASRLSDSPVIAIVSTFCVLVLTIHPCAGAGSCKLDDNIDPRNPRNTIRRCTITQDKDFSLIPRNTISLWVEFPVGNTVNFAANFPTLSKLEYLKIDVTSLTLEPKTFDENFQLPKLKSLSLIRDLNEVNSKNIAMTLEDDVFLGLFNLEELYLDNLGIQDLSDNALHGLDSLEVLDLTLNYISEIKPFMFSHCKNLTTLKLTDNFISEIQESSFGGLSVLESLDISLNKLKVLPAGPLVNLKELKVLVITSNDLHTIESGTFVGLGKLHYLSLARNNLSEVDPLAFQGLTGLEAFILDHNKLKLQMGQFAQASNILHLYMAHNDIKEISPDFFEGLLSISELVLNANSIGLLEAEVFFPMPTLRVLDIGDNKIKHVEENAFKGLTSLETLNIQENLIQSLPPGSFDDLTNVKTLYMDQNPWVCSCETEWLITWLRDREKKIEPEAQFFFIVCSDDDPIPTETFHALITSKHYFKELNCGDVFVPSRPSSKTTDKSKGSPSTGDATSTTEKNVIKVPHKHMTKTQKVIILVCSILAVLGLVAILAIHIYCRQKKHGSWVPPDQKKLDQQKSVIPQSKKVTTSNSDPEAGYWSQICEDLPPLYPNKNTGPSEILKAAGKPKAQIYDHQQTVESQQEQYNHVYQNHSYISDSMEYIHRVTDINHQRRGDLSDIEQVPSLQQPVKPSNKKLKAKKKVKLMGPHTIVQIERDPNQSNERDTNQQKVGQVNGGHHSQLNQNQVEKPKKTKKNQNRDTHSKLGDNKSHYLNQNTTATASQYGQNHGNSSQTLLNQYQPTNNHEGPLELQMELQSLRH